MMPYPGNVGLIGIVTLVACCAFGSAALLRSVVLSWITSQRDRRRIARGSCHRCNYDISGITEACPECGNDRGSLDMPPRRPVNSCGALVGIVLIALGLNGWWISRRALASEKNTAFIPSTVLVFAVDVKERDNLEALRHAVCSHRHCRRGFGGGLSSFIRRVEENG